MKKLILGAALTAFSVVILLSCEKTELKPKGESASMAVNSEKEGPNKLITEQIMVASAGSYTCGNLQTGKPGISSIKALRNNLITTRNRSYEVYQRLTYTYYKYVRTASGVEEYQPFHQFVCDEETIQYAGTDVPDNTKILIVASFIQPNNTPSTSAHVFYVIPTQVGGGYIQGTDGLNGHAFATTGENRGKPCIGVAIGGLNLNVDLNIP